MEIVLNGKNCTVVEPTTVLELISELELTGKFAIEINRAIIHRSEYSKVNICGGDRVEIVQAIGGG